MIRNLCLVSTILAPSVALVMTSPNHVKQLDPSNHADRLLPFFDTTHPLALEIRTALLSDGYCVLPKILTNQECAQALDSIWDFVEDTSEGRVRRGDPSTWKPGGTDPWPSTGYQSFVDMFQSLGAGWVLGEVREFLADRVFEPLYGTRELHSSKEGFTFLRPQDSIPEVKTNVCGTEQVLSIGEHFDQGFDTKGLTTIQSLVALEDQHPNVDGCFVCYPGSFQLHQDLTQDTYRGQFSWVPLTDSEIEQCGEARHVYLNRGDVVVWRSDLVHCPKLPSQVTPRFRAVAYCSMQPASLTPPDAPKLQAYRERQTGDHRPHVESWHKHRNTIGRPYFRTSPPLISIRQAELYGLLPYPHNETDREHALVRGVRFAPAELPTHPDIRHCLATLAHLEADEPLNGQDKYLGGMASPCGRYVYGVPGHAKQVLRINTESGRMDCIGPEYTGKFKWLRGVGISPVDMGQDPAYPDGCCLALPCNYPAILKINPATDEVRLIAGDLLTSIREKGWLYHGGNLAPNGWVYAIPANADQVLKFHPRTDEAYFIGPVIDGPQKWYGGILGADGSIYGIPHNHHQVLRIDPATDTVSFVNHESGNPLPEGQWKWHGGLRAGDKIIGFPNNADQVLVVDCSVSSTGSSDPRVYLIGDNLKSGRHRVRHENRYKWLGGALDLSGRYAYLFPCDAERVLKIDCQDDTVSEIGPLLLDGENKFQNGFTGSDGALYGIPQRATGVLRIIPGEDHVDLMDCGPDLIGVKDKFEGGVLGKDGKIYCIPLRSRVCTVVSPSSTMEI